MPQPLSLVSVVGFSGQEDTLLLHGDGQTLIYPLGSTVCLRDKADGKAQVRARSSRGWLEGNLAAAAVCRRAARGAPSPRTAHLALASVRCFGARARPPRPPIAAPQPPSSR